MDKKYDPITLSEAYWWARTAKGSSPHEAKEMQRLMLLRSAKVGVTSPDVNAVIEDMLAPHIEEEKKLMKEVMAEELRRRGTLQQEKIVADDDQIVEAIKQTLPKFQSDWDWGGIYRILVDCCAFPSAKTDFVRRLARMGIYPKTDGEIKDLDRFLPPAIRDTEWCGHRLSYQAIQKGVKTDWPDTYSGWLNSDIQDRDFTDRRNIATTFKSNLIRLAQKH